MSASPSGIDEITKVYPLEFLVTAENWPSVVRIFKEVLNIDKGKQDASDRKIQGQYFVLVGIEEAMLTDNFYEAIKKSDVLALVNDPTSSKRRNVVLENTYQVEMQLRKLLLHVSDIAAEFYEHFKGLKNNSGAKAFANKEKIIDIGELDPMTSHITFDEIIKILDQDLASWDKRPLTTNDLHELVKGLSSIEDLEKRLSSKIQKKPVWSLISEYVLEAQMPWDDLRKELDQLKTLRNKAAHFQVITIKDEEAATRLNDSIMRKIKRQKPRLTIADAAMLKDISSPFIESLEKTRRALEAIGGSYQYNLNGFEAMRAVLGGAPQTLLGTNATIEAFKQLVDASRINGVAKDLYGKENTSEHAGGGNKEAEK